MPNLTHRVDSLPLSSVNVAMREIRAHLRTLPYNNGDPVFPHPEYQVNYGIGLGDAGEITAEDTPIIRIWYDSFTAEARSTQFYVGKILPVELSLYVYLYSEIDDDTLPYRQALCEHIVRYLQEPESGVTGSGGLMPRRGEEGEDHFVWNFWEQQDVIIDHTSVFKKINGSVAILPPFYGSRIDITLHCRNSIGATLETWING
jgi:hypothetical protein